MPETGNQISHAVIAGAGIGGLTAALALAKKGLTVTILEKSDPVRTDGAGIQLSPNASHVLHALGLADALAAVACTPDAVIVRNGASAKEIARIPLGETIAARHGAPYLTVHRADLQSVLIDAVGNESAITLRLGAELSGYEETEAGVTVTASASTGGIREQADILIAADGLWSNTRGFLGDESPPRFTNFRAWRALVPIERLPHPFSSNTINAWLGPSAHFIHYPVSDGKAVNLVAVLPAVKGERGWNMEHDTAPLKENYRDWPGLDEAFAAVDQWRSWSIFDRSPGGDWGRGRVTLLGDAAHPMVPFLAQGGAMAIEDAAILADAVSHEPAGPAAALKDYEGRRRPRASRVQWTATRNGMTFHLAPPLSTARDVVLSRMSAERLLAGFDWLYSWRADQS